MKVSILQKMVLLILAVNLVYTISYTGYFVISGLSFIAFGIDTIVSIIINIGILFVSYLLYRFSTRKIAENAARFILDCYPGIKMALLEENVKYDVNTEEQIEQLRISLGAYDSLMVLVKYNYFILVPFIVLILMQHQLKIDVTVFSLVESVVLTFTSGMLYILSIYKYNMANQILKDIEYVK